MSMRKEVLKQSALLTFVSFFSRGLNFISSILIARMLLPEQLGLLDLAVTFFTSFFVIFSLNMPFGLARILPTENDKKSAFSAGIVIIVILSVISFTFFYLIQPLIIQRFPFSIAKLYFIVLFSGICFILFNTFQYSAQGLQKFGYYNLTLLTQSLIFVGLVAADYFFILPIGIRNNLVTGTVFFYLLSYLLPIIVGIFVLKDYFVRPNFKKAFSLIKECLKDYSAPLILSAALLIVQKFVLYQTSPFELGQNRVIEIISLVVIVPMVSLGTILSPKITSLHHLKPDLVAFKTLIRRSLFFLSFFILILSFIAPFAITIFFGEKYLLATNYVSLAFLGLFLNIFAGFILMLIFSVDSTKKYWTFLSMIVILFSFLLSIFLIPVYGLLGLIAINWIVNGVLIIYIAVLVKTKWGIMPIGHVAYLLFASAFIVSAFFVRTNILMSVLLCVVLVSVLFLLGRRNKVILPEDLLFVKSGINYLFKRLIK